MLLMNQVLVLVVFLSRVSSYPDIVLARLLWIMIKVGRASLAKYYPEFIERMSSGNVEMTTTASIIDSEALNRSGSYLQSEEISLPSDHDSS